MSVETMKQALDELEYVLECINQNRVPLDGDDYHETMRLLRQAIEQAEKQEPVAWVNLDIWKSGEFWPDDCFSETSDPPDMTPLYTAPPQREWVGLTDEEIAEAVGSPVDEVYLADFRKVVAKLRQKNAYGWQSVENPSEYLDELRGGADES